MFHYPVEWFTQTQEIAFDVYVRRSNLDSCQGEDEESLMEKFLSLTSRILTTHNHAPSLSDLNAFLTTFHILCLYGSNTALTLVQSFCHVYEINNGISVSVLDQWFHDVSCCQ